MLTAILVSRIDGLKQGPINLGDFGDDWLAVARPAIEARMNRYSSSETHFALLSIKQKRSSALQNEIAVLQSQLDSLSVDSPETEQVRTQLYHLRNELEDDLSNQERQRQENIRRRHNYIPFIMVILKALAGRGKLQPMVEAAKRKAETQRTSGVSKK